MHTCCQHDCKPGCTHEHPGVPLDPTDKQFTHLHLHTEFSTLDGINRIDQLPQYIKSINQKSVAITDHGNVAGSYKFFKACKKHDIQPIIGMEAYYTLQSRRIAAPEPSGDKYHHLVLLAQNNKGLKNLFKLSSKAYSEGMYSKPRCDDELLEECSEGLIATSACLGSSVSKLILANNTPEAERILDRHADIFKDRFFIELQLHMDREQQIVNQELIRIAKQRDYPLVLTNDCHYTHETDKQLHEAALCMQTNDALYNPKRFSFGDIDVHVAHHDWMAAKAEIANVPYEAIRNTNYVAKLIDSKSYFEDTWNKYPKYSGVPEDHTVDTYLEYVAKTKLKERMKSVPDEYKQRIESELKTIKKMGFSDYLLIVADFIQLAHDNDIYVGPGRGSAAGSLVAYALGITRVDPIKYGLLFERWLNVGRAATPLIF